MSWYLDQGIGKWSSLISSPVVCIKIIL